MKGQRNQLTVVAATTPTRNAKPRTAAGGEVPPAVTRPRDTTVYDRQPARPERWRELSRWAKEVDLCGGTYRVGAPSEAVHHGRHVNQREGSHDERVTVSGGVREAAPKSASHHNRRPHEEIGYTPSNPGTVSMDPGSAESGTG